MIASAGEFAHECGILPYRNGDARRAAEKWFKIWLQQRNCIGDREIAKVLKRVQDHFAVESENRYVSVENALTDPRPKKAGYSWKDSCGNMQYLMLPAVADEILKGINRKVVLDEMNKLGWLDRKKDGSIRETKSINGNNVRGFIFIPKAWEANEGLKPNLRAEVVSSSQLNPFK